MPIAEEQVLHIARLARLKLTPSELAQYSRELTKIIAYIDCLKSIDTENIEISPRFVSLNRLREDKVRSSLPVAEAMNNAPEKKDNYFIVPRVI